ncbi:MAG: GNAT family N-acetyltransferase [Paludibacteraceae bacterium]|nr:GNAT family N-acetyltransferase [Paludibacteraceae bacterium]
MIFRKWCAERKDIPLFLRDFWWDAVAPDLWEVWTFDEAAGQAFFVFLPGHKPGLRYVIPPQLTPCQGFWQLSGDSEFFASCQQQVAGRLNSLGLSLTELNVAPGVVLDRFESLGYRRTQRVTYRLSDLTDPQRLWQGFGADKKGKINKGERLGLKLLEGVGPEAFYAFMQRDHGQIWYSPGFFSRLCEQICPHHGEILAAADAEGRCLAAAFFVWDDTTVYYLCCAIPRAYRSTGASAWLVWQALRRYAHRGFQCFDFEGSMVESIAFSFGRFGATPVPFDKWQKKNWLGALALQLKAIKDKISR